MNDKEFKQVEKCNSVEEVLELAKANNKNITKEQAEELFNMTRKCNENTLSDIELSNVSGGSSSNKEPERFERVHFKTIEETKKNFIFEVGQTVEPFITKKSKFTKSCKVTCKKIFFDEEAQAYCDVYGVDSKLFPNCLSRDCFHK